MNKSLITSAAIIGAALIVGLNFEKFEVYVHRAGSTASNLFNASNVLSNDTYDPYSGTLDAAKQDREQRAIGEAWESFLLEHKNESNIKLIRDKAWGDYFCYSLDGASAKEDDAYADLFVAYLIKHEVLNKKDWIYEDLSYSRMHSVHPYGRGHPLRDPNPAMVNCRKPASLYRVNRYKRHIE